MFSHSKNVVISGSSTFNSFQNIGADGIDAGLKILYNNAAPEALHDSAQRSGTTNCHPKTRVAVRDEILAWLEDSESQLSVMWMNGAMGGGKSSIAQAIADSCCERKCLSGSFFFAGSSPTRNDEKRLVATLAYQMSKELPQMRPYISAAILHDPLIFSSSLKSQFEALIIGPHFHGGGENSSQPHLIIIDGLDECADSEAQALIVKFFVSSIASHREKLSVPLKVLIVSRPETNIEAAFHDPSVSPFVKRLVLNDLWQPSDDIKLFLDDSFADIKRSHPFWKYQKQLHDWPSMANIDELVRRSSGQFIYASVVIKFLRSHQNHPVQSLEVILGLVTDIKIRPYAELDALYAHIFSKVNDLPLVLRILRIWLSLYDNPNQPYPTYSQIEHILELPAGMLTVAFNDLVSVIDVDNNYISFHHHSLPEFLQDKVRSENYCIDDEVIFADLAERSLAFMKNSEHQRKLQHHYLRLDIFFSMWYPSNMETRSSICEAVSKLDIMSAILPMLITPDEGYILYDYRGDDLPAAFLNWIFREHANFVEKSMPHILQNAVANIKEWILRQYKALPFNGFDNPDGLDLWIFAIGYDGYHFKFAEIAAALSMLTGSDCPELVYSVTPSVDHCWRYLHMLNVEVLNNSDLFGKYSMSGTRYRNAALRLFKGISHAYENKQLGIYLMNYIGIERLLHFTPASKSLFKEIQVILAIGNSLEAPDAQNPSNDKNILYRYIFWSFNRNSINTPLQAEAACDVLADIFNGYLKKTRQAIPNIEIIVEEELKAKKNSATNAHKGARENTDGEL